MRIVGNIPHPYVKITCFGMNMRFSVKLEMGQMEQTFKIRENVNVTSLEDLSKLIDDELINECITHFSAMHKSMEKAFKRLREEKAKDGTLTEDPA